MLLSTMGAPTGYGAPPIPPRRTNPALIVLGVCGGCLLFVVIGAVVLSSFAAKSGIGGLISGATKIPYTSRSFLKDLKTHNYNHAASLVDPVAQNKLTAAKIAAIAKPMEARFGPISEFGTYPSGQANRIFPGTNGQPQSIEYSYDYLVTYAHGKATAVFRFRSGGSSTNKDTLNMDLSGKVTDFELRAEDGAATPATK